MKKIVFAVLMLSSFIANAYTTTSSNGYTYTTLKSEVIDPDYTIGVRTSLVAFNVHKQSRYGSNETSFVLIYDCSDDTYVTESNTDQWSYAGSNTVYRDLGEFACNNYR